MKDELKTWSIGTGDIVFFIGSLAVVSICVGIVLYFFNSFLSVAVEMV